MPLFGRCETKVVLIPSCRTISVDLCGRQMMKLPRRKFLHLAAGAAALPSVSRGAWAQAYPTRPVRAVVAFAPGGTTDTFARLMAQKLTEQFGKQVYVENIAGATGNIGTGQVAKAPPDGYTILFAFSSHVVNPTLFARLPYDPLTTSNPSRSRSRPPPCSPSTPPCRRRRSRSLSNSSKPIPANTASVRRGRARRRISPANSSGYRLASTSFTCPSAAAGLRSRRWSPGTRR